MPITVIEIFDAQAIAAGGSVESAEIDMTYLEGFASLQVNVTGDGTVKGEALLSNNDSDYVEPSAASDIFSGHTKTSGAGSDGKDFYEVRPKLAQRLKIKLTETGSAQGVTVSAWLAVK